MTDMDAKFCCAPFQNFEILGDGSVSPCCSLWTDVRLGNVFTQGVDEIWNSKVAQDFRASILNGSFTHCKRSVCTFLVNESLPAKSEVSNPNYAKAIKDDKTVLDFGPSRVVLAYDPTCNLTCPSCRFGYIRLIDGAQEILRSVQNNVISPILQSKTLDNIVIAGYGDPWGSPHYRSILRELADNDCGDVNITLTTNALLMDERRWLEYQGLERYRPHVCVSIDAIWPWTYERLRRPGKWERLTPNLKFISQLRKEDKIRLFEINMTVQADNYQQMQLFLEMGRILGCDSVKFYMIQNTGPHLAASYADANIGNPSHPEFPAFLEVLRNPVFDDEICEFYDVSSFRKLALAQPGIELSHGDTFVAAEQAMKEGQPALALAIVTARLQRQQSSTLWYLAARALKLLGSERRAEDCWKAAAQAMEMESTAR